MELSVVVPTLGRTPQLPACLAALAESGVERVLVLQGDAAAPMGCERLLRLPAPVGFAAATNAGIAAARRESTAVAVVNDDCVVGAGWLDSLAAALAADAGLAAVQSPVVDEHGRLDGEGLAWNRWWEPVQRGHGETPSPIGAMREIFGVSGTAALYRRASLDALAAPPFDERLATWYEDVDLAVRLRARGWAAAVVPGPPAIHGGGVTTTAIGLPNRRRVANRWLVLARLFGRELPRVVPRALVADLRQARRCGPGSILAGWLGALAKARHFLRGGPPLIGRRELERFRA